MRTFHKLVAAASVVAIASALAAAPAFADPINNLGKPVLPRATDIVGVGSDTIQNVFDQFSIDYNKTLTKAKSPRLYSWDALNPKPALTANIPPHPGPSNAPRPTHPPAPHPTY